MNFFGVGPVEILVILVIILIVFGPERLPDIAKRVGSASREIRQNLNAINEEMSTALTASMEADKAKMAPPLAEDKSTASQTTDAALIQAPPTEQPSADSAVEPSLQTSVTTESASAAAENQQLAAGDNEAVPIPPSDSSAPQIMAPSFAETLNRLTSSKKTPPDESQQPAQQDEEEHELTTSIPTPPTPIETISLALRKIKSSAPGGGVPPVSENTSPQPSSPAESSDGTAEQAQPPS